MQLLHYLRNEYAIALAATVPAFVVTLAVGAGADRTAFALFLCAAIAAAYWGGLRGGLLATALAAFGLVTQYHLLPIAGPPRPPADFWAGVLLFAVVGTLASYLSSECARAVATAAQLQRPGEPVQKPRLGFDHLRDVTAGLPIGVLVLDGAGRCDFCNAHCQTVAGFTPGEGLGDGWMRFVHPEDQEFATEWQTAARQQQPYATEIRFRDGAGRVRWTQVRAAPVHTADGLSLGLVGILEDISPTKELEDEVSRRQRAAEELRRTHTEQIREIESRLANIQKGQGLLQEQLAEKQRAEDELRRRHAQERREWQAAEERLRRELAEAADGEDARAELERSQAEWKRAEEKLRRELAELKRAKQAAEEALAELRRTEEARRGELERRQADWRQTEDKLRRQLTDLKETTELLEQEVADWQHKEQQAREVNATLARAQEEWRTEREELHEERNAATRRFEEERASWRHNAGWLDRVAEHLRPLAADVAAANPPGAEVRRLTLFADGLWSACRLVRHDLPMHPEEVELGELVSRVVAAADVLVQARHHHLTVKVPLGPQWLIADPARLEQALVALLDHAIHDTEPGGTLELAVEQQPDEVVFRVKDSGRGLAAEELPAVLALDARVQKFGDGPGLGLALVRGLIEEQGGRVEVVSAGPGQGSEVRLHFQVVSTNVTPLAA